MNEHQRTGADDDALLSAYLDDELDDHQAAALEDRLAADPQLARRLDGVAEVLVALRDLDAVEPPPGYTERLRTRLADERLAIPLAARRSRRRLAWSSVGAVAAALTAVAVLSFVDVLPGLDGQVADDAAPRLEHGGDEDGRGLDGDLGAQTDEGAEAMGEAERATGNDAAAAARPSEPVVVDQGRQLADADAVGDAFAGLPEATGLLGTSLDEARDIASAFTVAIQRAPRFGSGAAPAACLDVVTSGGRQNVLVPVRVEAVHYRGQTALAYVIVGARAGSEVLDRVEVWVVEAGTCATREFRDVSR